MLHLPPSYPAEHGEEPDSHARRLTEPLIWAARGDPAEMKRRVMLAWEHGSLTDVEAEEWIVLQGLEGV